MMTSKKRRIHGDDNNDNNDDDNDGDNDGAPVTSVKRTMVARVAHEHAGFHGMAVEPGMVSEALGINKQKSQKEADPTLHHLA
jgi:hypothetical protein